MPLPLHPYGSVPLAADPWTVRERLVAEPIGQVERATADALTAMGPQVRRWGLEVSRLPITSARVTEPGELGSIEVVWSGPEDATGWPSLTGRLVVVPACPRGSRLLLLSPRPPRAELATRRLDRLHRRQVVQVSLQRFLQDLGRRLEDPDVRPPAPAAARFGRAHVGDAACAWIGWRGDEKSTGWPQLDLALLVEARPVGSRLALLSSREPGYDLSVPRIDKQQRDLILRSAGPALGAAISDELADLVVTAEATTGRRLVA